MPLDPDPTPTDHSANHPMDPPANLTSLLQDAAGGDQHAMDRIVVAVYGELQAIARRQRAGERIDHTLNTTGIVHEAYLKLVKLDRLAWQNRAQFFAIAARTMRQILIDHARKRRADKRGGDAPVLSLDGTGGAGLDLEFSIPVDRIDELIGLDIALQRLETQSERYARIVECRFFAGLTIEETADALEISPATVKREWALARAWLNRELSRGDTKA